MRKATITYYNKNCEFTRDLRSAVEAYFAKTKKPKVGGFALWAEAAVALLLYLTPLALLYAGFVTNIFWTLGLAFMMGIGYLMVGADIMHAANHGTFSKNNKINKAFSYSMELLGMSSRNWRVQHNDLHHMHTNVVGEGGDTDLTAGEPILRYSIFSKMKGRLVKYQYVYAWFAYSFSFILWIFNKDFKDQVAHYKARRYRFKKGQERSLLSLMVEMVLFKLAYLFLFIGLPILLGAPWYFVVILWMTSTMLAGAIMMPVFQVAHAVPEVQQFEAGAIDVSWLVHQIRTSADVRSSNRLVNWVITHVVGGLNYQKVHHAFRDISHVHYPALSRIIDEYVAKHKIESVTFTSVRSAVYAHYQMMRQLGAEPVMTMG